MPKISFLVLTYNSASHIQSFLNSFFSVLKKEFDDGLVELIIEDNNSTDDTVKKIRSILSAKEQKNIKFTVSEKNNGYAKGINNASKKAQAEILIVVNPDSELVNFESGKITHEFEKNNNLAIAGFKIVDFSGSDEKTAGKFFNPLTFLLFSLGLENIIGQRFSPEEKKQIDFVSGGFIAFRKFFFEEAGGYDEDYFMYVEDMDICYRAKEMGKQVYFLPYAKICHKGQGSSNREFAIVNIYKGLQIFYDKHGSLLFSLYIKNLLSIKAALIIFIGAIIGKKELVSTYTKALKSIV